MKNEALSSTEGLPHPRRTLAVVTMGMAVFMTVIDQTIANVALPTIGMDLHVSPAESIWIINAFQLAVLLPMLPLAAAGDILGYKRVYLCGLSLFTLASLGCALSSSLIMLTMMRMLQGLGAAGVMSVNMALVRFIHPINRLGHGIGINAVIIATGAAAGPTIASTILAFAPWPWLFAINVPIGCVAAFIGYSALPDTPLATHRFDVLSAVLNAITFGSLIAFVDSFVHQTPLALTLLELFGFLGIGGVLLLREFSLPAPLVPVDLLRIPMFGLSVATSICSFVSQTMALIALPFWLQRLGFSAVDTGFLIAPWPVANAVFAPIAGRLSDRYPAGLLGLLGLLLFAGGLTALALIPPHANPLDIAWRMAIAGAGFGLFQTPNNRTMQASAPRVRSGGAAGMQGMARLIGQTTGAAFTALVFSHLVERGAVTALEFGIGFAVAGALVSALRLYDFPQAEA